MNYWDWDSVSKLASISASKTKWNKSLAEVNQSKTHLYFLKLLSDLGRWIDIYYSFLFRWFLFGFAFSLKIRFVACEFKASGL